jgi:hypothetical protein
MNKDKLDKLIETKIRQFLEQFANPNPFPAGPQDSQWTSGPYAQSIPSRKPISGEEEYGEEEEEEEDDKK